MPRFFSTRADIGSPKERGRVPRARLGHDRVNGTPVLAVRGELDVGAAPSLSAWLTAATDHSTRAAIVDLRAVTFMAAAGLHVLCDEQERLLEKGLGLTVVCRQPQLL